MPVVSENVRDTNRSRRTPSDAVRQHPIDVYIFSHSRLCHKPSDDDHPRHRRSYCLCPAAFRPAPTPSSTTATSSTNTTTSCTPPADGATSDVPSPPNITTSTPISSDVDLVYTCSHSDRTSTPQIGLVDHLRIQCLKCPHTLAASASRPLHIQL
ncbi:hypothetical protein SprV_0602211300 [Sparganum proliferum]